MLQSPAGATIAAMMKATGWQQHSVRGFLAGVVRKRLKLKLGSKKVDGNRVYQIAGAASAKPGARRSQAPSVLSAMPRVKIGPALPDRKTLDVEIARLRDLDVGALRARWHTVFGRRPPPHLPRHLLFRVLAYRLQADHWVIWTRKPTSARSLWVARASGQRAVDFEPAHRRAPARHRAGPRMERPDATGGGAGRWLCLERQDLSEPVEGCLRDHRHPLERAKILRPAGQAIERSLTMKAGSAKPVRCAIYTRVSTDQGLEQDFNSLDAQYDASQAYIRSQAHAGWTLLRAKYDDGGFSGGNTDRPALQRLLEDVTAGKVDVIVVYKVDRLTRSLADFAKLVELFDKHDVSFVSVTQQFNTTTSMGRLTLNVLLSFAQFEREVTSERIRDKIAASKRKGLWVGGMAPLGYDTKDRKITVNEAEADRVRTIFRSYLKLGSLNLLMADLRKRGIVTKVRTLKTGKTVGGIPFTRGPLAHLLRNRFYVGEVAFKGEVLSRASSRPLSTGDLFDAVQAKLNEQVNNHKTARMKSEALLAGRIFDDRGNRMTPSHARKRGIKYRYYLSSALLQGQAERAGSIRRVPAAEIEALVIKSVREHLKPSEPIDDRASSTTHVARVEVQSDQLVIQLAQPRNRRKRRAQGAKHPSCPVAQDAIEATP